MQKSNPQFTEDDIAFMKAALALSKRGLGNVYPNPSVGCVIVKDNHVIGRGWTGEGGYPHGEVNALNNSIKDPKGSTVYVTLEPCAHYGKTPPCAETLVNAGVERVIIATGDPDPRVSGEGIKILKNAGIEVETGLLKEEADAIHIGFFSRIINKRPMVTVKIASSEDGKISKVKGEQHWITGEKSRRRGHLYRASHDAIMVGIGTALIDDPMLDCRIEGLENASPIRVLLDTHLKITYEHKLCKTAKHIPLWIMTASVDQEKKQQLEVLGVRIFILNLDENGHVSMEKVLNMLAREGITRILSEGGARVNASLIKAKLVDRLIWFKSADSIGEKGINALYDISINELDRYITLSLIDEGKTGPDHWQEFEAVS